jgi:hypothetical protein
MLPVVAFDWSGKAVHVTFDGVNVTKMRSEFELVAQLTEPHRIVCEASLESYDPDRRTQFIETCAAQGHDLRTVSQRLTSWWRIERDIEKSDEADARAIYALATDGRQHLKRPGPLLDPEVDEWAARRAKAERELMVLRRSGRKDAYAKRIVKLLPKPKTLDPTVRLSLCGSSSSYSLATVAACAMAVEHTTTKREWEKLLGLSASGKNSQFRSDLYRHNWRHRRKTDLTLSEWRRSLRWLYHHLVPIVRPDGTNGP